VLIAEAHPAKKHMIKIKENSFIIVNLQNLL